MRSPLGQINWKSHQVHGTKFGGQVKVGTNEEIFPQSTYLAVSHTAKTTHDILEVELALMNDTVDQNERINYVVIPNKLPVMSGNSFREDEFLTMSTANAKAIGLSTGLDPIYPDPPVNNADASIFFNSDHAGLYDFDPTDGIISNKKDFVGIVAHEIGHALGFFSITDTQDRNPNHTLYPNTLDIWRHQLTGVEHEIDDVRIITAGNAEYYDRKLNNLPFSEGLLAEYTHPSCGTNSGVCSADHWRNDAENLMDPAHADGIRLYPTSEDLHAFDYIGYNIYTGTLYSIAHIPLWQLIQHMYQPMCKACFQQFVNGQLADYPIPPNPANINPPIKDPNYTVLLGLNTESAGLKARSATGFARFETEKKNKNTRVLNAVQDEKHGQWEQLVTGGKPMKLIPAHLADFYFESDSENGVKFYFRAIRSKAGIPFNPSLGKYGGFRVSGFIDAMGDKKRGDIDANMTFELLLNERVDINKGFDKLSFGIDISTEDNEIKIQDFEAFGLKEPTSNRKR